MRQRPRLLLKLFAWPGVPAAGWCEAWGGGRRSYPAPESLRPGGGGAGGVKGHFKTTSIGMYRVGFGPSYFRALTEGGGRGGRSGGGGGQGGGAGGQGGGAGGDGERDVRASDMNENQRKKADEKAKLFRHRMQMENNRRNMASKNIVAFTKHEHGDHFQEQEVCGLLFEAGFTPQDVEGVMINCYRPNQIEVTFAEKVKVDLAELSKKIGERRLQYSVSNYAYYEESLIIYGLPFGNLSFIKGEIGKSIKDFVSKIIDISPCYYKKEQNLGDFFNGKLTGNWRVRVVPKAEICIPNFIAVGKNNVQGKVVYGLKANMRIQQCVNCYSEEHLMNSPSCPGIKEWREYCQEFEEKMVAARDVPSVMDEDDDANESEDVAEETREGELRGLIAEVEEHKEENRKLKETVKELTETKRGEENISQMEISEKEEAKRVIESLKKQEEELKENIEARMKKVEEISSESESLKLELERLKKKNEKSKSNQKKLEEMTELAKSLQETMDRLTKENLKLKEKEQNAENREGILAASLERSQEFENLMDGVENVVGSLIDLEDDPLISTEDLKNKGEETEQEDDTEIMSDGNEDIAGTPKRQRDSPENGEINKKVNRGRIREVYDGQGNFVKVPLLVDPEKKGKALSKESAENSNKSKEKEITLNVRQYLLRSDVPPPVPPRPPSRSNSAGPPVSRANHTSGVIVPAPLSRRGSVEQVTGFDENSKEWISSQE